MTEAITMGSKPLVIAVPVELAHLRPDLQRFFDAMIYKLRRNKHKGRWEDLTLGGSSDKLLGEVNELNAAIEEGSTMEILFEAADVANFALILAAIALEGKNV